MKSIANRIPGLLRQIHDTDEALSAWVVIDDESAGGQAKLIDDRIRAGEDLPLAGMTVGIKDIIDVRGMPTTGGFEPFTGRLAGADAPVVARLRQAGAVIVGKTVTTQFASSDPSITKNPWDLERTPGGSSAGSAASVAAGQVDLALGTQTGGSVLRPSAYCGIVGFKPGYGWTSTDGVLPFAASLDTIGIHARSVFGAAGVYDVLARPELPRSGTCEPVGPPRLAIWNEALNQAGEQMRDAVTSAISALAANGAIVHDSTVPVSFDDLISIHTIVSRAEGAAAHANLINKYPDDYRPKVRAMVEAGMAIPADIYIRAQQVRDAIREELINIWSPFDALVLPTSETVAPDLSGTGNHCLQAIATLFGFPSITLPIGLNPDNLPRALQLVGTHPGDDVRLLRIARWIEERLPRLPHPPYGVQRR